MGRVQELNRSRSLPSFFKEEIKNHNSSSYFLYLHFSLALLNNGPFLPLHLFFYHYSWCHELTLTLLLWPFFLSKHSCRWALALPRTLTQIMRLKPRYRQLKLRPLTDQLYERYSITSPSNAERAPILHWSQTKLRLISSGIDRKIKVQRIWLLFLGIMALTLSHFSCLGPIKEDRSQLILLSCLSLLTCIQKWTWFDELLYLIQEMEGRKSRGMSSITWNHPFHNPN